MGRMMPVECQHGAVIDWGDFGGDDSSPEPCAECDAARLDRQRTHRQFLADVRLVAEWSRKNCTTNHLVRESAERLTRHRG